ncbi:hypothetical protein ACE6H2_024359 [Prunus campanulata]
MTLSKVLQKNVNSPPPLRWLTWPNPTTPSKPPPETWRRSGSSLVSRQSSTSSSIPPIDLNKKRKVLDEIAKSSTLQPHIVNFLNILANAK